MTDKFLKFVCYTSAISLCSFVSLWLKLANATNLKGKLVFLANLKPNWLFINPLASPTPNSTPSTVPHPQDLAHQSSYPDLDYSSEKQ